MNQGVNMGSTITIEQLNKPRPAKISVIGVGGGGANTLAHLYSRGISEDVNLIVANTDVNHLEDSPIKNQIILGKKNTGGNGVGMKPDRGEAAARESEEEIRSALMGSDMVIIASGLGGGTGSGATPVVAELAKELGALVIAVVTKPFTYEMSKRMKNAEESIEKLRKVDSSIIVIPNDKILGIVPENASQDDCFKQIDEVLTRAVLGISNIVLKKDGSLRNINVDFADIQTVMEHKGLALMGIGDGKGENALIDAIRDAIDSPLLDNLSINNARGFIINLEINPGFPLMKISKALSDFESKLHKDVDFKQGVVNNPDMAADEVRVTIIATGFEQQMVTPSEKNIQEEQPSTNNIGFMFKKASGSNFDIMNTDYDTPPFMRNKQD